MNRLFILITTVCIIFCGRPAWAEEINLTLNEAINLALRDNRSVMLQAEDVKKSKAKLAEAKSALFPTLDFTAKRAITRGLYSKSIDQTSTHATLTQYLYTGGATTNTIAQYKYKLAVSNALLDKEKLETVLDVENTFYTLLLAAEFSQLNKGIMENTRSHLAYLETRYKSGQTSESDVLKLRESVGNIEKIYASSGNQVESGKALLRNLLYLNDDIRIKPEGELAYEEKEIVYDEAFLKALSKRPEIRQYEAQEEADKKAVEIAKADSRPAIYASWDYYSFSHTTLTFSPQRGWNDYNVLGGALTWPLFDGWLTKAKVEQALVDLKNTRLTREKVVKDIELELKNSYLDLKTAVSAIKASEAETSQYKNNVSIVEEKYRQGAASSLDLDDALIAYKISLFNQKQAIYNYLTAKARFEKAVGGA
ncbi:MAG: TolC family protein [Candidatus Omnitrophica bacterium]|nr:TolC family protein [Candidatus Omnitrophota bacterium]